MQMSVPQFVGRPFDQGAFTVIESSLIDKAPMMLVQGERVHITELSVAGTIPWDFPQGKLPGDPKFTSAYYDLSKGAGARGHETKRVTEGSF
jgi:hypothetical protein